MRPTLFAFVLLTISMQLQAQTPAAQSVDENVLSHREKDYWFERPDGSKQRARVIWQTSLEKASKDDARTLMRCFEINTQRTIQHVDERGNPTSTVQVTNAPPRVVKRKLREDTCPDTSFIRKAANKSLLARYELHEMELEVEQGAIGVKIRPFTFPDEVSVRLRSNDPDSAITKVYRQLHQANALPTRIAPIDSSKQLPENLQRLGVIFRNSTLDLVALLVTLNVGNPTVRLDKQKVDYDKGDDVWLVVPNLPMRVEWEVDKVLLPKGQSVRDYLDKQPVVALQKILGRYEEPGTNAFRDEMAALNPRYFGENGVRRRANLSPDNLKGPIGINLRVPSAFIPLPSRLLGANSKSGRELRALVESSVLSARAETIEATPPGKTIATIVTPESNVMQMLPDMHLRKCADPLQTSIADGLSMVGLTGGLVSGRSDVNVHVFDVFPFGARPEVILDRAFALYYVNTKEIEAQEAEAASEGGVTIVDDRKSDLVTDFRKRHPNADRSVIEARLTTFNKWWSTGFRRPEILERAYDITFSTANGINALADFKNREKQATATKGKPAAAAVRRLDAANHGFHTAGMFVARENGIGVCGIFPMGTIKPFPLRLDQAANNFDGVFSPDIVSGLSRMQRLGHCNERAPCVVNISASEQSIGRPEKLLLAIDLVEDTVLLVAAAGAASDKCEDTPQRSRRMPACIGYPLRRNVITVTAGELVAGKRRIVPQAASLPEVALIAPGAGIVSSGRDGFYTGTGSSHAAPFVSATAALLAKSRTSLSATEIVERILYTADLERGASGKNVSFGWLNAQRAYAYHDRDRVRLGQGEYRQGTVEPISNEKTLKLYTSASDKYVQKINAHSIRRIFVDPTERPPFNKVVIFREGAVLPAWPGPIERSKGKLRSRTACVLKVVRNVHYVPLRPAGGLQPPKWSCEENDCLDRIFTFSTVDTLSNIAKAEPLRLEQVTDLVIRAGTKQDPPSEVVVDDEQDLLNERANAQAKDLECR